MGWGGRENGGIELTIACFPICRFMYVLRILTQLACLHYMIMSICNSNLDMQCTFPLASHMHM